MRLSKAHCLEMNLLRRRNSGDTIHGRVESGDHPWHPEWSLVTMYGAMDGRGDLVWRNGTIHGTVDGPAGLIVGGPYMA